MAVRVGMSLWPQGPTWPELCATAVRVDDLGFDSLWLYDHFLSLGADETLPVFDGWTGLAALAALTSRARLGVLVTGVTYRNPAILAKMTATLDHISRGRVILGLGAGWHEREHRAYGIEFPSAGDRISMLDEACIVIHGLLNDDVTNYEGSHYALSDAVLFPKPVQRHVPLLIGGGGERKTLRVVARHASLWNAFGTPEVVVGKRAVLDAHCAAVHREPADIEVTVNLGVIVRDTPREVEDRLNEIGEIASFPDYAASNRPWGPPELVATRLAEYANAGVSEIIAVMPAPYDHQTIERLATEVAPRLRQLPQPSRSTP